MMSEDIGKVNDFQPLKKLVVRKDMGEVKLELHDSELQRMSDKLFEELYEDFDHMMNVMYEEAVKDNEKKIKNYLFETFMDKYRKQNKNTNDMKRIKFKNFKWKQSDALSLEEYIDTLQDEGWGIMGTTAVDGKVIIHCQWSHEV